jgi:hypothetical protein
VKTCPTAPVALFFFKRPEITAKVLERIREAKPAVILLVADGPRADMSGEQELCDRTRELVLTMIDWNPTILKNFSDHNLGCRKRISSGLSWVFEQVPEAIILEDDCVPDSTFFRYASELLERYRDNPSVGAISGDNFQPQPMETPYSYYFSRFFHCYGWASWRRAWTAYDDTMSKWPSLRDQGFLRERFPKLAHSQYWAELFDAVHQRRMDTWDYPWVFALWNSNMVTITPRWNLVTNIGIGADSTHMKDFNPSYHGLGCKPMLFPLIHPDAITVNQEADLYSQIHVFGEAKLKSLGPRILRLWKKILKLPGRFSKDRTRQ